MDEQRHFSTTRKLLAVSIVALALVALGISSYLTWATWQQSAVAGCVGGSDCDEVLSSSGSKWLGIPVSLLGAVTYLGVLGVVWPATRRGGWLMTVLLTLTLMAAGGAMWFIVNQAFIVKHFCTYCMTVHACGLLICLLTVFLLRTAPPVSAHEHMRSFFTGEDTAASETHQLSPLQPVIAAGIASLGLAALIGGQVFFAPSGMEVVEDIPLPNFEDPAVAQQELAASQRPSAAEPGDAVAATTDIAGPDESPVEAPTAEALFDSVAEEVVERDPADVTTDGVMEDPTPVHGSVEIGEDRELTEPAGEAVVATDEPEPGASQAVATEAEYPAAGPGEGPIAASMPSTTGGQTFEELFGEAPLQLEPLSRPQPPMAEAQVASATGPIDNIPTPTASTSDVPQVFRFKYLRGDIDAGNNPVLGNPYAPRRLVEMLDYTCPHCRKLHRFVEAAVARYGRDLGIVIYHVPLSRKCNQFVKMDQVSHANACEYARLAFAVWKVAPDKFAEYHSWLMEGDRAPAVYLAKQKAMDLAGDAVLTDKSIDVEAARRFGEHAADLEPLNVGLPVLIFDAGIIKGLPGSEHEWFQMLEQRLGLTPSVAQAIN